MGPIEDKDLKAAWHILKEFQGLGPRKLNGNKAPTVGSVVKKTFSCVKKNLYVFE